MKILIVDDKAENRILLRYIVKKFKHEVLEAENGQIACELFEQHKDIDLILMDVMMPVMDGMEATRRIKQMTENHHVAVIFVTALDNQETLETCLKAGGDDFIPKPVNSVVLAAKLQAHERIIALHRKLEENNQTLQYHQALIQAEHQVVNKIFNKAMQKNSLQLPGLHYYLSPVSLFNGDLLLVKEHPTEGIYLLVGDFTGHGLSAAIGSLPLSEIFFSLTDEGFGIGLIAEKMDARLKEILPTSMFCCAALLNLNKAQNTLSAWVGGLDSLMITDATGKLKQEIKPRHLPLGVHWGKNFDNALDTFSMTAGDSVIVYTDGITEAVNPEGDMFGADRLKAMLTATDTTTSNLPEQMNQVDYIIQQVDAFCGTESQRDDMTIAQLVCQQTGNTESGSANQSILH